MAYEKTNAAGYMKHSKTGVVINTNEGEYKQILAAREKLAKEQALKSEVTNLKSELDTMKSMLTQILDRLKT